MHFNDLLKVLKKFYDMRNDALKESDLNREKIRHGINATISPVWWCMSTLLPVLFPIWIQTGLYTGMQCQLSASDATPWLPEGRSDGGYAVADFRKVQEELGTMDDFAALTAACHNRGINVCLDFVMNHTSEDHEWANAPVQEKKEYQDRYFSLIIMIFLHYMSRPARKCSRQLHLATSPGWKTFINTLWLLSIRISGIWTTAIRSSWTKWSLIRCTWLTRV